MIGFHRATTSKEGETMGDEKHKQVAAQAKAVAYLARELSELYGELEGIYAKEPSAIILDMAGDRTASFMEKLGDMLNATDGAAEDNEWLTPIFEEAQRLWPQTATSSKGDGG